MLIFQKEGGGSSKTNLVQGYPVLGFEGLGVGWDPFPHTHRVEHSVYCLGILHFLL